MLVVGDAGDFNGDGIVNAADYVAWRKRMSTQSEYNAWRAHFGQRVAGGSGAGATTNTAVPEPATVALLMSMTAGWYLRRRRTA
jgi:PEP-CTERM motif